MKQEQASIELKLDNARRCLEAYGGDVSNWPADQREAYGAFAQADALLSVREDAALLDEFLSEATAPKVSHDLQNRIMAGIDLPSAGKSSSGIFGFFANWQLLPASVMTSVAVCIGGLGLVSGFTTANLDVSEPVEYVMAENQTPEYEAFSYLEYSGDIFADDQEGETQ